MTKYILTIYIGRFSPFHNGHAEVLKRAQNRSDSVLVLVGSINQARTPKNPWTFLERATMIYDYVVRSITAAPVAVLGIRDFPYNDQLWIANVHKVINTHIATLNLSADTQIEIRITGADRDESTFYLKYFPEYVIDLAAEDREVSRFLTATSVREIYFGLTFSGKDITLNESELLLKSFLPLSITDFLKEFEQTKFYSEMREEHIFNVNYRKPYKDLPYEVIFHTVDAIIFQTGYVLLVKRRANPGKGLWALPGGFLNPKERLFDAAIRELREETGIKVPEPVLRGSLVYKENFDYPGRSLRGRTITTGFVFKLPDFVADGKISLPHVKGADDAEKAAWVSIDVALQTPEMFFEDHHSIIEHCLGKL